MSDFSLVGYETIRVSEFEPILDKIITDLRFIDELKPSIGQTSLDNFSIYSNSSKTTSEASCSTVSCKFADVETTCVLLTDSLPSENLNQNMSPDTLRSEETEGLLAEKNKLIKLLENKLEEKEKELNEVNKEYSVEIESLRRNNDDDFEKSFEDLNRTLKEKRSEVRKKCDEIRELEEKLDDSDEKYKKLEKKMKKLANNLEEKSNELIEVEKSNCDFETKLASINREMKNLKKNSMNQSDAGDSKLKCEKLEKEKETIASKLLVCEEAIRTMRITNQELIEKDKKSQIDISQLKTQLEKKSEAIEAMKKKINPTNDSPELKKLQNQLRSKNMEYDQLEDKLKGCNLAFEQTSEKYDLLKKERDQLRKEIDNMKQLNLVPIQPRPSIASSRLPEWWKRHADNNVQECPFCHKYSENIQEHVASCSKDR